MTRTAAAVALALGGVGLVGAAASAGSGCPGSDGWVRVADVPAGTTSVQVAAPSGSGIAQTCVRSEVETQVFAFSPAASSAVISPAVVVADGEPTPSVLEYAYRLVSLETTPVTPAPAETPTATPTPTATATPAPASRPAPAAATAPPSRPRPEARPAGRAAGRTDSSAATASSVAVNQTAHQVSVDASGAESTDLPDTETTATIATDDDATVATGRTDTTVVRPTRTADAAATRSAAASDPTASSQVVADPVMGPGATAAWVAAIGALLLAGGSLAVFGGSGRDGLHLGRRRGRHRLAGGRAS